MENVVRPGEQVSFVVARVWILDSVLIRRAVTLQTLGSATAQKTPWNRPATNPFTTPAELFSGSDTEEESDAEVEASVSEPRAGRPKKQQQRQPQPSYRPAQPQPSLQAHVPYEQDHLPTRPLKPQDTSPWSPPASSFHEDPGSSGTVFQAVFGSRLGIFGHFAAFINSYAPRWTAGQRVPPKKGLYKTKSITKAEASKQVRQDRVARNKNILERERSQTPRSPQPQPSLRTTDTLTAAKLKRQDSALRKLAGRDDARHTERVLGRSSYNHVSPPRLGSQKSQPRSTSTYRAPSFASSTCSSRSTVHSDDERTELDDPMDEVSESDSAPPTPATPKTPHSPFSEPNWTRPTTNTYEPRPSFHGRRTSSDAIRASPRRTSSGRQTFGASTSTSTPPRDANMNINTNTNPNGRRRNPHSPYDPSFSRTRGFDHSPGTRAFGAPPPPPLFTANMYGSSGSPPRPQQRSFVFDASHGEACRRFPRPGQDPPVQHEYTYSSTFSSGSTYTSSSGPAHTSSSGPAYTYSSGSTDSYSSGHSRTFSSGSGGTSTFTASSSKPKTAPVRPTPTSTTMHLTPLDRYETLWKRIARPPTSGVPLFTLKTFPWPGDRMALTADTLARFFGVTSGSRTRVKGQLVRWHPDKFRASSAVERWVEPADWEAVCEAQEKVVVALTELLRRGDGQ